MAELRAEIQIPEGYALRCVDGYEAGANEGLGDVWPEFKLWSDDGCEFVIYDESVGNYTPAKWRLLLAESDTLLFSDNDYATFSISREGDSLRFATSGALGGKIRWSMPIDRCRNAIEHVAATLETHIRQQKANKMRRAHPAFSGPIHTSQNPDGASPPHADA